MTRIQRESAIVLAILVAIVAATGLTDQSSYALNRKCEPEGFASRLRAAFQGRAYWVAQLKLLDESTVVTAKSLANAIEETSKVGTVSEEAEKFLRQPNPAVEQANRVLEDVYSKYPKIRPSPASVEVDQLRAQANALELADMAAQIRKMNVESMTERLDQMHTCRPEVMKKAQSNTTTQ